MNLALQEAKRFEGATTPNPAVGAVLVQDGAVLGMDAHPKAGESHAEPRAIIAAKTNTGRTNFEGATLYVTLEPCNHTGRTPPCTQTILDHKISRVIIGTRDPNPKVKGGGAETLIAAGVEVVFLDPITPAAQACRRLIAPFVKFSTQGLPYLVHKLAYRIDPLTGRPTMIPDAGATTFSSQSSLILAHELRKKSDAIITGLGTVLADNPQFTVRHVVDHAGKKRFLAVVGDIDRLSENPANRDHWQSWVSARQSQNFEVFSFQGLHEAIQFLGAKGCMQALIEAGPGLSKEVQLQGLWDQRVTILAGRANTADRIFEDLNEAGLW